MCPSLGELSLNLVMDILLAVVEDSIKVLLLLFDYVTEGLVLHLGAFDENSTKFGHII